MGTERWSSVLSKLLFLCTGISFEDVRLVFVALMGAGQIRILEVLGHKTGSKSFRSLYIFSLQ